MKKMFLKRLLVLCIAGAVVFSTSACNRNYDKDERIEDEDDDDDDSEKLSKKDKDALEQMIVCQIFMKKMRMIRKSFCLS